MTSRDKATVIRAIVDEIVKSPAHCVLLARLKGINGILPNAGIQEEVYGGKALRAWLSENFSADFYCSIGGGVDNVYYIGAEYPQARAKKVIALILTDLIRQKKQPVTMETFTALLREKYDIDLVAFLQVADPKKWLLSTSSLRLTEAGFTLEDTEPVTKNPEPVTKNPEWEVFSHHVFLTGLDRKLQEMCETHGLTPDIVDIKKRLARAFADVLFRKNSPVFSGAFNGVTYCVFPFSPVANEERTFSCVLTENTSGSGSATQYWLCYKLFEHPDEDPVSQWAEEGLRKKTGTGLNFTRLQEMTREVDAFRVRLSPIIERYIEDMNRGMLPHADIAEEIRSYEIAWHNLAIGAGPYLQNTAAVLTLDSLQTLFSSRESIHSLYYDAVGLFRVYLTKMDSFLTERLGLAAPSVAALDLEAYAGGTEHETEDIDIEHLEEILSNYMAFEKMCYTADPMQKLALLQDVREYFRIDVLNVFSVLGALSMTDAAEMAFLADVRKVSNKLADYTAELASLTENRETEKEITIDELYELRLNDTLSFNERWIDLVRSVLPDDPELQQIVSGPASGAEYLLTPFEVGTRLYLSRGNEERLPEKYFLLGSMLTESDCVPAMLRLCREEKNYDRFFSVWQNMNGSKYASDDDMLFMLEHMAKTGKVREMADYLYDVLVKDPELRQNPACAELIRTVLNAPESGSDAFRMWCAAGEVPLNPFEKALSEHQLGNLYEFLDSKTQMAEMGYPAEEVEQIKLRLRENLPAGISSYSRGLRILNVQGNKNRTAERFFWFAAANKGNLQACQSLFDLYREKNDNESICWLVSHIGMPSAASAKNNEVYAGALAAVGDRCTLSAFAETRPDILRVPAVQTLLAAGTGDGSDRYDWGLIISLKPSATEPCAFEDALLLGDADALRRLAEDGDQMALWGYNAAALEHIRAMLQGGVSSGTDLVSACDRIWAFQKNLHGFYESTLYSAVETERSWFLRRLSKLLFSDGRYEELIVFFEANADLRSDEQTQQAFLWSLLYTKRYKELIENVEAYISIVARDRELREETERVCRETDQLDRFESLEAKLWRVPKNPLEECLLKYDEDALHALTSEREKLQTLGYSEDRIDTICAVYTKGNFERGNDAFSVACRVRMFLGDERAIPFYRSLIPNDPRAARVLFDIYQKEKRHDDICYLYRSCDGQTWNEHFRKLYIASLIKATDPENCEELVRNIEIMSKDQLSNADTGWNYIRALIGSRQPVSRIEQEEEPLLAKENLDNPDLVYNCFDLAWSREDKYKEYVVNLAERLLLAYEGRLPYNVRLQIASVHGKLLAEEERGRWASYLKDYGMQRSLFILKAAYGFLLDGPEEKLAFLDELRRTLEACMRTGFAGDRFAEFYAGLVSCRSDDGDVRTSYNSFLTQLVSFTLESALTIDASEFDAVNACLSMIDLTTLPMEAFLSLLEIACEFCTADSLPYGANVIGGFALDLLAAARERLQTQLSEPFGQETEERLRASAVALCGQMFNVFTVALSDERAFGDAFDTRISAFIESPFLSDEQAKMLGERLLFHMQKTADVAVTLRILPLLYARVPEASDPARLLDAMIAYIREVVSFPCSEKQATTLATAFAILPWNEEEFGAILNAMGERNLLRDPLVFNAIRGQCVAHGPQTEYTLYKTILQEDAESEETLSFPDLYGEILTCARQLPLEALRAEEDLQLIYQAVCKKSTREDLSLLYSLYAQTDQTNETEILAVLLQLSEKQTAEAGATGVRAMFDERPIDWIEFYYRWWKPLVSLSDDDVQTKKRLSYLTDERPPEDGEKLSAIRLLMSDIYDAENLKICRMPQMEFTEGARRKMLYLKAAKEDTSYYQVVSAIQTLFRGGDYEMGAALLRRQMDVPVGNSSFLGQLLGDIYTLANVEIAPVLTEMAPDVYRWILKMNEVDPQGVWKNDARAVVIARLTGTETALYEILGESMFLNQPGHCSAVIAALLRKNRFEDARRWHEAAFPKNPMHKYLNLEDNIIRNCMLSGGLSYADALRLDTIPQTGNNRSLEEYGKILFNSFMDAQQTICERVLADLYPFDCDDRALLLPLMRLTTAEELTDAGLETFYEYAKRLLRIELIQADKVRAAFIFTAASVCLPTGSLQEESWIDVLQGAFPDSGTSQELMTELFRFKSACEQYLLEENDRGQLLMWAMGHWTIDDRFFGFTEKRGDFSRALMSIHPIYFSAACVRAVLEDPELAEPLGALMKKIRGCETCAAVLGKCALIPANLLPRMLTWFSIPLESQGAQTWIFRDILNRAGKSLNPVLSLFFATVSYSYELYNADVLDFKKAVEAVETVEEEGETADRPDVSQTVLSVLAQLSFINNRNPNKPQVFLDLRQYDMLVNSAEYYAEQAKQSGNSWFVDLNQDFSLLGKIMSRQLTPKEMGKIPLYRMINITILLCESKKAYVDMPVLLNLCEAKWKICLRCAQELIQGCPNRILYVMEQDRFWNVHTGSAYYVKKLADYFLAYKPGSKENPRFQLERENSKENRALNWGTYEKSDIRGITDPIRDSHHLWGLRRTPVKKVINGDFRQEIDAFLAEMENEDRRKSKTPQNVSGEEQKNGDSVPVQENEYYQRHDYHRLSYINEALEAWREKFSGDGDPAGTKPQTELDKLCAQIDKGFGELNDPLVRIKCIELGMFLFRQHCVGAQHEIVTEEALDVLREVTDCISDDVRTDLPFEHIRVAVHNILYSPTSWTDLLARCKPWLVFLCEKINDENTRSRYAEHIRFIQETGEKLSGIMTTTDAVEYVEQRIRACRANPSSLDMDLKQVLVDLLNDERRSLGNLAQILLDIYEKEQDAVNGEVTGMLRNVGMQSVSDVSLELRINDVSVSRCVLQKLDPESAVPFSLPYAGTSAGEELPYQLRTQYVTAEGRTENFLRSGNLRLCEIKNEDYHSDTFDAGHPAENAQYVERIKLQKALQTWYSGNKEPNTLPSLAIYGMRRMGKTSLLRWLQKYLQTTFEDKIVVVNMDLEGISDSFPTLAARVRNIFTDYLSIPLRRGLPSLSRSDWATFCEQWKNPYVEDNSFSWLLDYFTELREQLLNDRQIVLIIDEAEGLYTTNKKGAARLLEMGNGEEELTEDDYAPDSDGDDPNVETQDRTGLVNLWNTLSVLTQDRRYGVTLILCGADTFTNTVMEGDNLTQFFQRIEKLSIGRMTSSEIEAALRRLEESSSIRYHRDSISYLWTLTAGLPWHSKLIVNEAIRDRLDEERRNILYPYDILYGANKVYDNKLDVSNNSMGMSAVHGHEAILLRILSELADSPSIWVSRSVLWETFKNRVPDNNAEELFNKALRLLIEGRQLIVARQSGTEKEYRFGSEFNRLLARDHQMLPQFIKK